MELHRASRESGKLRNCRVRELSVNLIIFFEIQPKEEPMTLS
jgi:hypothetical protein